VLPVTLQSADRLGSYRIQSALGAGAMGEVYRAIDTRTDRPVAIRLLPADFAEDAQFRDRFVREARAMAELDHPALCKILESGEHDGRAYLVMQFLDGETLARRLERGALPFEQVLKYALDMADALVALHRGGITHGSLRPGNIVLTRNGATLADFGLAKLRGRPAPLSMAEMSRLAEIPAGLTKAMPLGDIHYLAPEQVEGREADARTDIWAYGAIVYEMATGLKPFGGETAAVVLGSLLVSEPLEESDLRPHVPRSLSRVLRTCMAKDRAERWQTAHNLHAALLGIADEIAEPSVGGMPHRAESRRFGGATAILVTVAVAIAIWLVYVAIGT
jgi:serine/threonine-protein kinase